MLLWKRKAKEGQGDKGMSGQLDKIAHGNVNKRARKAPTYGDL